LPYAKAVDFRRIEDGDLLQMIWYMSKSPRKQIQLYRRPRSLKQFKGAINGVNAVRLYSSMRNITLSDLAVASGRGVNLLTQVEGDIGEWIARNRRNGR
jgi:hypothetical protein